MSIVRADDLCEDEPGSELLYLLGYEWTPPLEVSAARISTMDSNGVWSPPLEETHMGLNAATTQEDYDIFINGRPGANVLDKLPACYYDLANAFLKKDAGTLPPHRPGINHEIHLKLKGKVKPPFRKPYPMHNMANDAIKKWIDE